jgi:hypothetical protein
MRKLHIAALIGVVIVSTLTVGKMMADNHARERARAEQMRAKAEQMKAKAEHLEQEGRYEEARRAWQEAKDMWAYLEAQHTDRAVAERVDQMRAEAEELARAGRHEEAERLMAEAEELSARVDADGHEREHAADVVELIKREMREMQAKHEDLIEQAEHLEREGNREGLKMVHIEIDRVRKFMAQLEKKLHEVHGHHGHEHGHEDVHHDHEHDPHHEMAQLERRIAHMRAAAENLEAAGMGDRAHDLFKESEEAERHLRRRIEALEREHHEQDVHHDAMAILHEILENIHGLRAEVAELHEAIAGIREEFDDIEEASEHEEEESDEEEMEEQDDDEDTESMSPNQP